MNFVRLLGRSDKIYKKFGDYCIAEDTNECVIVCSCCQDEHQTEESFWQHINEVHNYALPSTIRHMLAQAEVHASSPEAKRPKLEKLTDSEMYGDAQYYEQLHGDDINDPDILNDLTPYLVKHESVASESETTQQQSHKSSKTVQNLENEIKAHMTPQKFIDVERIGSRSLLNGKVLKKVLQQMQRANLEFKYKLNRLSQEVSVLERELHDEQSMPRKKYMKIIPDKPMTTRDEVLILDGELQRSKEMRNNLQEEALMVITQSPDVYCRVLWRFIMTDEVSNQFCWRGVIDGERVAKYPIKDMMIMDIFQAAFREKFPSLPLNTFKEKTITYFNKANERIKRTQNNKLKNDEASDDVIEEVNC